MLYDDCFNFGFNWTSIPTFLLGGLHKLDPEKIITITYFCYYNPQKKSPFKKIVSQLRTQQITRPKILHVLCEICESFLMVMCSFISLHYHHSQNLIDKYGCLLGCVIICKNSFFKNGERYFYGLGHFKIGKPRKKV